VQQGTFTGSNTKKLAYRVWLPAGPKRGVVVIVHGYTEHGGRYARFAEKLTEQGLAVYAHDHAGHGLSEGVRGHIDTFDTYVEDLRLFIDVITEKEGTLPLFLFGQSMGGAVAMFFAARYGEIPRGCILSAPAFIIGMKIPPVVKGISTILSAVFPKMKVTKGIAEHLSRDPNVIAEYLRDPLVYTGKNRARLGSLLLRLEETLLPVLPRFTVPVCIMQGTEDKIVDPKGARLMYEQIASDDKTLQWFNALYHELLHEPEKNEVMKFSIDWILARLHSRK
jgi:acylglycerol lipase